MQSFSESVSPSASPETAKPSAALLSAALAGLLGFATPACSNSAPTPGTGGRPQVSTAGEGGEGGAGDGHMPVGEGGSDAEDSDAGTPEVFSRVLSEEATLDDLLELCGERGGWTYVTAFCAGSGQCAGLFLNDGTLSEYSCKGMNTCGGTGCVDLPEDSGKTGEEVYETAGCDNCHGKWNDDYSEVDLTYYTLVYPDTITAEDKIAEFRASSLHRLTSIMVFGTQGLHPNGSYYSNMPSYREKYSLAEIQRTLRHIQELTLLTAEYEVPAADDILGLDGGVE